MILEAAAKQGELFDNRYEILRLLGAGGIGAVYAARQIDADRLVALKVLHARHAGDAEFNARFIREAQALCSLKHDAIVSGYHMGIAEDSQAYIAMELVEGPSLKELLKQNALSVKNSLSIAAKLCSVLTYIHNNGILHRDLKPDNIIILSLAPEPVLKIIDFGLACISESSGQGQKLTNTGAIMGSLEYMSPEQCKGLKADARSDLYALCVCLFEMLSGSPPFKAESPAAFAYQHLQAAVPPLEIKPAINRAVLAELNSILKKGLAKDPLQRYQTAAELESELNLLLESIESGKLRKSTASFSVSGAILISVFGILVLLLSFCIYRQITEKQKAASSSMAAQNLSTQSSHSAAGIRQFLKRKDFGASYKLSFLHDYLEKNGVKGNDDLVAAASDLLQKVPSKRRNKLQYKLDYRLGMLYYEAYEFDKAIPYLKSICMSDPAQMKKLGLMRLDDRCTTAAFLQRIYVIKGLRQEALKLAYQIVDNPAAGGPETMLTAIELGDNELIDKLIEKQLNGGELVGMARVAIDCKRYELAKICLERAELMPLNESNRLYLEISRSKYFLKTKRVDEAKSALKELLQEHHLEALVKDPRRYRLNYELTVMLELTGMHKQAEYFAGLCPQYQEEIMLLFRAHLLAADGNFAKAAKLLNPDMKFQDAQGNWISALSRLKQLEKSSNQHLQLLDPESIRY